MEGFFSEFSEFLVNMFAGYGYGWIEATGAVLSIIAIYLTAKGSIWCWPISIVSCCIYIYLLNAWELRVETWTWIYYLIMGIYGWIAWKFGPKKRENDAQIPVRMMSGVLWAATLAFIILFGGGIGYFVNTRMETSSVPYVDAFTSGISLVAQFWMANKFLDCWVLWIVANIMYIGMYSYLGYYPTAVLHGVYLVLAVKGLMEWKNEAAPIKSPASA